MPFSVPCRRASQLALTSLLAIFLAATMTGCGAAGSTTGGSASSTAGASSSATTTGTSQTLSFDRTASRVGRPRTAPESTLTATWFPPDATLATGLRQLTDKKQIAELARAAAGNSKFWIERPNDAAKPLLDGSVAVSALASSTGFSTALIVPVRDVTASATGAPGSLAADLLGRPASYQVLLAGDVGDTSFGLRKGTKPGEWLLDPSGELVNWGATIDAVSRDASFTAEQAYVTHTAFDLGGRPAVYLTWAVFRDASGKEYAVALHNPPPIKATWAIDGKPLRLATVYPPATVFGPVLLTPTN